jgi:hypothetical protein
MRNARNLPITVDRRTPAHLRRGVWTPGGWSANWHRLATLAGVTLGLVGGWLALQPATIDAGFTAGGYLLGGAVLAPAGASVYQGRGVLVLAADESGSRAGGSAVINGRKTRGTCYIDAGAGQERCVFLVGSRTTSSVDHLRGGAWHRRYDDGSTITIRLSGGRLAPVPFPLGFRHG